MGISKTITHEKMTSKTLLTLTICCLLLSSIFGQNLTEQQVREDLNEMKQQFEKFHSGYTRYTVKQQLDRLFEQTENEIKESSVVDLYKKITLITSKIRCGHTRASLPENASQEFRKSNVFLPFTVSILNERLYVFESLDPSLKPGNEIISINNLSVSEILKTIFEHHSSDGFIQSGKTRLTELYFHYYFQLYLANNAASFKIALADTENPISVNGKNWDELETIRHKHPSNPTLELEHHESYSYMKIGSFSTSALHNNGFGYKGFLAKSFKELKERNTKNLILDLRGNGGGRDEFGALLVSYFLKEPFGYFEKIEVTDDYEGYGNVRKTNDTNYMTSHSGLSEQATQKNSFRGKLFLLTDGWTFSTAADVVSVIDNANRALIVGEETGGGRFGNTSGVSKSLVLPNSEIRINLPMWKYTTSLDEKVDDGRGVIPDVEIIPTIQQQLSGEDIPLNYCLDAIKDLGG